MTFETFLDLLVKLATLVSPNADLKKSLDAIIEKYFVPLYKTIMTETIAGDVSTIVNKSMEPSELRPFYGAEATLLQIYECCFGVEYHKEDDFSQIEQLRAISQKAFFSFCISFELIPQYLERGLAQALLEEILAKPLDSIHRDLQFDPEMEHGFVLTYSRFLLFLVVVSRVGTTRMGKLSDSPLSQEEVAALLLHHIQQSPGFKSAQERRSVSTGRNGLCTGESFHNLARLSSTSAQVKSAQFIPATQTQISNQTTAQYHQESQLSFQKNTSIQAKRLRSLSKNKKLVDTLNYKEGALDVFEKFSEPLNQLYSLYAGMGEPLNTTKLKSIKFHKMLRDAGLMDSPNALSCRPSPSTQRSYKKISASRNSTASAKTDSPMLSAVEVDLIFVQLTGVKFRHDANSSSWGLKPHVRSPNLNRPGYLSQSSLSKRTVEGKLELETFLKAIELIAVKLYPNLPISRSVETLVVGSLIQLLSSVDYEEKVSGLHQIAKLKEILANPDYVRMMGLVHDNVQVYFNFYSDSKKHMNFDGYVRFLRDFGLFPQFVSKARLAHYFYTLASLNVDCLYLRTLLQTARAYLIETMQL